MDLNLNEMIISLTRANIEFEDIYTLTIPRGKKSEKGTTNPGVCGLVFPVKGKAKFTIDGESTILEPGIILHAGAGVELYKEVIGETEWKFVLLHYKLVADELTRKYMESMNFNLSIGAEGRMEIDLLLQKLIKLQEEDNPYNQFKMKVILHNIFELIIFYLRENMVDSKEELINHIVSYIHENMDKYVSISQLAEMVGMDSKQFYYAFLKYIGMCPKKYLIQSKIKKAKELLQNKNYTISKVSAMVGYEDPLHFSRMFKKNIGVSPSMYQELLEKNPWRI